MKIFQNKRFAKFASKEGISNDTLIQAVKDAEAGNIAADYGGGVIKQRIARTNEGKSGGYRTIIFIGNRIELFLCMASPRTNRPT